MNIKKKEKKKETEPEERGWAKGRGGAGLLSATLEKIT